jgi:hypothetical protein
MQLGVVPHHLLAIHSYPGSHFHHPLLLAG